MDIPACVLALATGVLGRTDVLVLLSQGAGSPPPLNLGASQPEVLLVYAPGSLGATDNFNQADQVFHLPGGTQADEQFQPVGEPFVTGKPRSFLSRAVGRIARYLTRQQVGLVLSGGAALAPTQAGVLAGLEERAVDVDLIVGTGFGSLLGAAYAIGLPIQSLERLGVAFQTPREDILALRLPRRANVARGRRLRHLLRTLFGMTPLQTLHVPLWVVATDADTAMRWCCAHRRTAERQSRPAGGALDQAGLPIRHRAMRRDAGATGRHQTSLRRPG